VSGLNIALLYWRLHRVQTPSRPQQRRRDALRPTFTGSLPDGDYHSWDDWSRPRLDRTDSSSEPRAVEHDSLWRFAARHDRPRCGNGQAAHSPVHRRHSSRCGNDPRRTSEDRELASPLTVVTAFSTSDTAAFSARATVDLVPRADRAARSNPRLAPDLGSPR
jgi:hypothetical protein